MPEKLNKTDGLYDLSPLIKRIKKYAIEAKISDSTASGRVFGDGDRLLRLEQGKTCTLATAQKAWLKLDKLEAEAVA